MVVKINDITTFFGVNRLGFLLKKALTNVLYKYNDRYLMCCPGGRKVWLNKTYQLLSHFTTIVSTEREEVRQESNVERIYKITAETNARNERGMLVIAVEDMSDVTNVANHSHDLLFRKKPRPLPQAYSQNSPKIKSRK
jgi:hypothetical protein